jgi:hypothetical protein
MDNLNGNPLDHCDKVPSIEGYINRNYTKYIIMFTICKVPKVPLEGCTIG